MTPMKYFLLSISFFICSFCYSQESYETYSEGAKINFRVFGEGKPVLIINGGPGFSSDGFTQLAAKISKMGYQTILFDQRGTGRSYTSKLDSTTISMDLMLADIESIRKAMKIDEWVVLGHSFGGMLGSYYTSKFPEHVRALITSSSGGIDLELLSYLNIRSRLNEREIKLLDYWSAKILAGDDSYFAKLQRAKNLAPAYVYKKQNIMAVAEKLTEANNIINTLIWLDMQKMQFDCRADLACFSGPALIIQGENDFLDIKTANKVKQAIKNSEVLLIPECGHYGWLDQPEIYYGAIRKFLGKLPIKTSAEIYTSVNKLN